MATRRRRRSSLVALLLALHHVAAEDSDMSDLPGRVTVSALNDAAASLDLQVLTTSCGSVCSTVAGAAACVEVATSEATCKATRAMPSASCREVSATESALCMSPEPKRWSLTVTHDAETLALARENVTNEEREDVGEGDEPLKTIVLNASDVTSIRDFALPAETTQLVIRSKDPAEELDIPIATDVLANWQSLEKLFIRGFDLSDVTKLPSYAKLVSLQLSRCRLKTWSIGAAPALSTLDLSVNALSTLPAGSLPVSLRVLNVSSNNLVEFPVDIASLQALNQLSVSSNNFAQLTIFPKLPELKELDLSHNNFAQTMSNSFPASLVSLKLRNCSLKTVPGDFGIEKTWQLVDLSENPFPDGAFSGVKLRANHLILEKVQLTSITSNIKNWPVGETLSLSQNALGSVDAAALPADISTLLLSDCSLEVPSNLTKLPRLSTLDLSKNQFGPITSGSLPSKLTELSLGGCQLDSLPTDVAAMSATLESLDLSANNLTEVKLETFSNLRSLDLHDNALTTIPPEVLTMTNLRDLNLRGNPVVKLSSSLTDSQRVFLSQLNSFEIDASAFAVEGSCLESVQLRGKYTVCLKTGPATDPLDPIATDKPGNSTATPTPSPSTTKAKASPVLNIVLGCSVFVVMVVSIFVARMPPRKRNSLESPADLYDPMATGNQRYGPIDMWEDPELLRWRVDILDIELVMQVGIGANSVLWLARYQTDTVIVKRLYYKRKDPRAFERFVEEIKFLGRLVHENIVQFLGVSWTSDSDLQMVLEFMSNGDLQKYLKLARTDASAKKWSERKIRIAMDICQALVYLHSHDPALLHRDLRSHHVLLDDNYTAKLTDFGMCRHRVDDLDLSMVSGNSSRSIAPEVLARRGSHGKAVDMYAFGVILVELDSHEPPFSDITLSNGAPLSEMAMLELLSTGALQPSITADCPQDIAYLIADCLSFDPQRRPTAENALHRLMVLMDSFEALGSSVSDGPSSYFESKTDEGNEDDDNDSYKI